MKLRAFAFAPALLAAAFAVDTNSAYGAELIGGYSITYAKGPPYDAAATTSEYTTSTNLVSSHAEGGPGFSVSAQSQTTAWTNRIKTTSDLTSPIAGGFAVAAALSLYAINQVVTGPGATATISYEFNVDGSFAPGPDEWFAPTVTRQNMSAFLVGYYGTAQDIYLENGVFYLETEHGRSSLNVLREDTRWQDDGAAFAIPEASKAACPAPTFTCLSAITFEDQLLRINAEVDVGRPFVIVSLVSAYTNGETDFMNTVKLQSVALDPAFTLTADDGGALTRSSDGSYALAAAAVPEPATWAMMIFGFAGIGFSMRRRTRGTRLSVA